MLNGHAARPWDPGASFQLVVPSAPRLPFRFPIRGMNVLGSIVAEGRSALPICLSLGHSLSFILSVCVLVLVARPVSVRSL